MSHRMKMNQHIITMASPPGGAKLFKRHCSGAFLAPQQAGGITGGNACSRCCACKLSLNKMCMLSLLIVVLKTAQIRVRNMFEILRYMRRNNRHRSQQRP